MKWLENLKTKYQHYKDVRRLHRTENTKALDDMFDATWEFDVASTLGKFEHEITGAAYLGMARREGHFVAVPRNSPLAEYRALSGTSDMIAEGLLIEETIGTGIKVVSPSRTLAFRMYGRDRGGKVVNRATYLPELPAIFDLIRNGERGSAYPT